MILFYVFSGFAIILGVVSLIVLLYKMCVQSERHILDEMLKNKDIDIKTYTKYINF